MDCIGLWYGGHSLRHPAELILYLELQTGLKLGHFPASRHAENSHPSSNNGLNEAGEPNFLRILEVVKLV